MDTQTTINAILDETRCIAVIGASDKPHRAVYGVMQMLQSHGYRCLPVNPRLAGQTLLGETVYARLADIPEPVDTVDMFINSEAAGKLTDAMQEQDPDKMKTALQDVMRQMLK